MKSTISYLKILAGATCVLAATACDSVRDVENKTAANVQPETVVLAGEINGLSSLRSITLQNNDDTINTRSVINAVPTLPNVGVRPVPFSFGAVAVGTAYNITIKQQPELKTCVVVGGQGVLTKGVTPNIVVNCTNSPPATNGAGTRYDLTVQLPPTTSYFSGLQEAKVRVTTEEEIREVTVTPGQTSVTFTGVLINSTGSQNPAPWTVNASTFEGNRLNKCVVTNATNVGTTGVVTGPTANVGNVVVGAGTTGAAVTAPACQFSVSGRVGYSLPAGATTIPAISGLRLQLRDTQSNVLETLDIASCTPTTAAVTTALGSNTVAITGTAQTVPVPVATNCPYSFVTPIRSSSTSGLYEVAVSQQPTGQACIVVNGGSVSVVTLGTIAPVSPVNVHVFCRALPSAANRELNGVFRLQSTTFVPNVLSAPTVNRVSTWNAFDTTFQNTASSNMMGFFRNGTFMYGTHANGVQVEQGFYDYDPVARTLRLSLIVDTNISTTFPATFSPALSPGATPTSSPTIANTQTFTPGISALPNPIRSTATNGVPAGVVHHAMTNVTIGTADSGGLGAVKTLSGIFGADPAGIATTAQTTGTSCSVTVNQLGVITATVPCINPLTGATLLAATPATPVPVPPATTATATASLTCSTLAWAGLPNGCYFASFAYRVSWVLQEPGQINTEMTGAWQSQDARRVWMWDYRTYYGTSLGMLGGSPSMNDACFTMENLHWTSGIYTRRGSGTGCFPFARPAVGQTPAYILGTGESTDYTVFGPSATTIIPQLPDYTGRIPGGQFAPGTFSPSPVYFQVAPAASFFTVADPTYFPPVPTNWCTTEILGLRSTSNGSPINPPVYFCRTVFNQ
jgi:hypothetical protein